MGEEGAFGFLELADQVQRVESIRPVAYHPPAVANQSPDLIFTDGFETNSFTAWGWANTDVDDLAVSTQAAAVGNYGMMAVVDDTNPIYVEDYTPANEKYYSARFYFDPHSVDIGNGPVNLIADASWHFCLYLQQEGVNYSLALCGDDDAGGWLETDPILITDAWQSIEIEWKAASAAFCSLTTAFS